MPTNEKLETTTSDVVDVATRATKPHEVQPGKTYVVTDTFGKPHIIDRDIDQYLEHPRRKTGTVKIHDADTFAKYVAKHGLPETEIYADEEKARVVAVLNASMGTTGGGVEDHAGWQDHRALLQVRFTPAWESWMALDKKLLSQTRFAEHIEDRAIDIVKPSGADMLELAQSITATVGVTFESSKKLSSGERQLEYKETVDAKAGHRGRLDIPSIIELALVPFQGAPAYKVTARFRYRIVDGTLQLAYALERPEDVLRNAFADVVSVISGDVDQPIFMGWPE